MLDKLGIAGYIKGVEEISLQTQTTTKEKTDD